MSIERGLPPSGAEPGASGSNGTLEAGPNIGFSGSLGRLPTVAAEKPVAEMLPAPSPSRTGKAGAADLPLPAGNGHLPPQSRWGGGHGNQMQLQSPEQPAVVSVPTSSSASPQQLAWNAAEPPAATWVGQPVTSGFALASQPDGAGLPFKGSSGQLPPAAPTKPTGTMTALSSSPVQNGRSVLGKRQDSEAESELDHELMVSLIPDLGIGLSPPQLSGEDGQGSAFQSRFPSRKGHPICDFYQKTGHCKVRSLLTQTSCVCCLKCLVESIPTPDIDPMLQYGAACRFDHPSEFAVVLNKKGLPIRPGEPVCGFYAKKGECRYGAYGSVVAFSPLAPDANEKTDQRGHAHAGPSCKFSHPDNM